MVGKPKQSPRRLNFGEVLAFLLDIQGMRRHDLAVGLGIDDPEVDAWIEGRKPPPDQKGAREMARVLGLDPRMILVALEQ